jgi:coenzyme F420 hydrogenase subunit beta
LNLSIDKSVISGNYCIGCGACAVIAPDRYKIAINDSGCYESSPVGSHVDPVIDSKIAAVCPFSQETNNEDIISQRIYPDLPRHTRIGSYLRCCAGKTTNKKVYNQSSSGGIGRWVLAELLKTGKVDAVIHVQEVPNAGPGEPLFRYGVSREISEVEGSSRSAYYPVEMSGVLDYVRENPGRYAITGVPCFIKAIRNLSVEEPIFKERICYTVGIVCGHLKSKFYAEMLGWQMDVHPSNLGGFDFRVKIPGKKANEKGVSAIDRGDPLRKITPKTVQQLFGTNYGQGYFKYNACDYCDDVLAETADIAVGDAWLPEFLHEGTSIVVVRNAAIADLLRKGEEAGEVSFTEVAPDAVAKSQDAGLRHRREGLAYRLHLKKLQNLWAPPKRVEATPGLLTFRQRQIQKMRLVVAESSYRHFKRALSISSWDAFHIPMLRVNRKYYVANVGSFRAFAGTAFQTTKNVLRTIRNFRSSANL